MAKSALMVRGLLEGHVCADEAVELGLKMRVGDEEKGEGLVRRCWCGEDRGRYSCREAGGSEKGEELSAAGCVHGSIIIASPKEQVSEKRMFAEAT